MWRRDLGHSADDPEGAAIRFGRFTLDEARGCLSDGTGEIWLRPQSFAVLRYMARNARRLVSKAEIFDALWTRSAVTDDSLVQCVSEIRQALGADGQRLIRTVPRRGYLFDASDAGEQSGAIPDAAPRAGEFAHRLSIAVGPLRNITGDPNYDAIAEALTANLVNDLSSIRDSMVVTPNAVVAHTNRDVNIREIARAHDVRYVFTGSVQGSGTRVRINCQLVDARVGTNVWAERFEHDGPDPWTWQAEVTRDIARTLKFGLVELASRRSVTDRPDSPDAIDLTMRGLVLFSRFTSRADVASARVLFEAALRLDPSSLQALVGFAGTHVLELFQLWADDRATQLEQADAAVERALEIDPLSAEVRYTRANLLLLRGEPEPAIAEYRAAIDLNPTFSHAHARIGQANVEFGRPAEAFKPIFEAMRLNPPQLRASLCRFYLGTACFYLGQDDKAAAWFEEALAIDMRTAQSRAWLAAIHALHGRPPHARAEIAEFNRVHPGQTIASLRASQLSRVPEFLAQRERLYQGIAMAGLPLG